MEDHYLTIKKSSEGIYKEKGSKFIAFALPAHDETTAKTALGQIKKAHHNARHHCFAYVIGTNKEIQRANDDGEPSNAAGKPILNQINTRQLTNVMIVVVRYFGGTLLGVSGLIHAYKTAASEALNQASIIKEYIFNQYEVSADVKYTGQLLHILSHDDIQIMHQDYHTRCQIQFNVRQNLSKKYLDELSKIPDAQIKNLKKQ